mmetsp:Transcript_23987/g.83242  ORF Transcript_23987/g.83242 Transcript_23987/m.83242 type:complete len:248 (+) Transcript_23987:370-1113(+)
MKSSLRGTRSTNTGWSGRREARYASTPLSADSTGRMSCLMSSALLSSRRRMRVHSPMLARSSAMGYRISIGSSTKTGPGTPLTASWNARRIVGTMSATRSHVATHLQMGLSTDIWSMSCRLPLPRSSVAAAPPMRTRGDSAICAFLTAVTVFVTPGPAVTAATPGTPVRRATASAANTAVTSCRTSTTRMPVALAATRIGEMCPPTSVNRNLTPCALSTCATSSPPWRSVSTTSPSMRSFLYACHAA